MTSRVVDRPAVLLDGADAVVLWGLLEPVLRRRLLHGPALSAAEKAAAQVVRDGAKAFAVAAGFDANFEIEQESFAAVGSWLSVGVVAARLGASPQAVRAACRRGDLRSRQVGRGPHEIEEASVERYAQKRRLRSAA